MVAGDTLQPFSARYSVGIKTSTGSPGILFRNTGHNFLQRIIYDDSNSYELLCVTEGDDDDKGNGFFAYDSTNNVYLFVSVSHTGGGNYVNRYKKFFDLSAYNFGTNQMFR